MPDPRTTGRRIARAQHQILPVVDSETRHGTVTAVAWVSGRAKLTVDIEGGGEVPGIYALGHYLGPKVDDHVLVVGSQGSWTCLGTLTAVGPPLVKIGARVVSQLIPTATDQVLAFAGGDVGIDTHGWADAANERVVPTIEGWYRVVASCRSTGNFGIGDRLVLSITVGGVTYAVSDNVHGGTARIGAAVASVVYCDGTASDDIDVRIFQNTGGGATFEWTYSVELVRPDDI
ncbi:MAG: hypothetical protein AAGA17_00125 [Actinomycetota bacterium]